SAPEAVALSALCNDPFTLAFLASASFPDAKRPITKALLQRLDLRAILERADRPRLRERAARSMVVELGIAPSLGLIDQVDEALAMVESVVSGPVNPGSGVVGAAVGGE